MVACLIHSKGILRWVFISPDCLYSTTEGCSLIIFQNVIFFNFFRLFVFVFKLFEHPWHAIDVFVRLRECCLKSPIILLPKKSILFYLGLFGNISGVIFKMCCGLLEECKTLKYWSIKCWWHVSSIPRGFEGEFSSLPIAYILWLRDVVW